MNILRELPLKGVDDILAFERILELAFLSIDTKLNM